MTISFNKETHTFTDETGRIIPSVTQLLKKHKILPYTDFATPYMKLRMAQGTYAHEEFEGVEKGTLKPEDMMCDEADTFRKWYAELPSKPDAVEYMVVYKDVYAGIVDMIYTDKEGKKVLVDHKTGKYHEKDVSWQMFLYGMALAEEGIEIDRFECWCYKDKTIHDVPFIVFNDFKALIEAEKSGKLYGSGELVKIDEGTDNALSKFESMLDVWEELDKQYKDMKKVLDGLKDKLYKYMLAHNINEPKENNRVRITLTRPSHPDNFDMETFSKEHPDLKEKYTSVGTKKGYVTVTWKDAK